MDNLSRLIANTARRAFRQRSINALGFFLPLGIALFFLAYSVVRIAALPVWLSFLPPVVVLGFLLKVLLQEKRRNQNETIASLLDEKTDGQERFLTLVTLPASSRPERPAPDFLAQLQREAARKAAVFAPKRDLPFRLDRRVPLACVGAVLSGLLFFFLPTGGAALRPDAPAHVAAPSEELLQDIEKTARELARPQSTPEEQQVGAQLLVLSQDLRNPAFTPQQKMRLIDEAQKRMNLPVPIPQILPIDLKLFGSESKQDDSPGNQGDSPQPENTPLAKTNENLEQLKKSLSATHGNEQSQGPQKDSSDQSDGQQSQRQKNQPQESGGGIKFDQPQDNTGKKQAKQNPQQTSGQQQKAPDPNQKPDAQQPPSGVDPQKTGQEQQRNATQQDGETEQPQQAKRPDQSNQQPGKSGGKGEGERFYKQGEPSGGFLTQDARYVKVRIPTGLSTDEDNKLVTDNTDQAAPTTPYSNAPLVDRPQEKNTPQQRIPLEYRAIFQ